MEGVQVMSFQKEYPNVNLKMQKETPRFYEYAILNIYAFETEHGIRE